MQQRPGRRSPDPIYSQEVPGAAPSVAPSLTRPPAAPEKRRVVSRSMLLLGIGIVLEALYLALYPLLVAGNYGAVQLPGLLSWHLYWTTLWPQLPRFLARIPWLDITRPGLGAANVLLLLLCLACAGVLLAATFSRHVARGRLSQANAHVLFWIVITLTGIFGLTLLFAPMTFGPLTQDMVLYGLYGRMVVVHHVNPYAFDPANFPQDPLQVIARARGVTTNGPLWTDVCIILALLTGDRVANTLFSFRALGLLAHLANTALLWSILAKMTPGKRVAATLCYAWNPLVLLLGVALMHLELVLVLFLLLAVFFFQRNSLVLSWIFVLLAALLHPLCLLLLPLFLCLLARQTRLWSQGRRVRWWSGVLALSLSIVVLAYAPYWQGWGFSGLLADMRAVFLQGVPVNSLNAALLFLPVQLPAPLVWLLTPHHWAYLALAMVGVFLLSGLWLIDTLELGIFFSCWLFLLLLVLEPVYWPWYVILPLALALASTDRRTILFALLLMVGGLFSFYCWLGHVTWLGQGLGAIGLPLIAWGWALVFGSLWRKTRPETPEIKTGRRSPPRFSRPAWLSRPSLPSRPGHS